MLTPAEDIRLGWKSRPLQTVTLAAVSFTVTALCAGAWWILDQVSTEARTLARAWPVNETTLILREGTEERVKKDILNRLESGSWWGVWMDGRTATVEGTPPEDLFSGDGTPLSPELISYGEPMAWLRRGMTGAVEPGGLVEFAGIGFRVMGHGEPRLAADRILTGRNLLSTRSVPGEIRISEPASRVRSRLHDQLDHPQLDLVEHETRRQEGLQRLRRVQWLVGGLLMLAAALIALLLQALYQGEIQSRRSEFALRRALGATPGAIRNQILVESVLLSALSAAVAAIGAAFFIPVPALVLCWSGPVVWMVLCAVYPAFQAASLAPGTALKGENYG